MIAVGVSQNYDTRVSFYDAVNQCNISDIALALVFAGARHDPLSILSASRSKLPGVRLFGGSVVGTITRDAAAYSGYEMTVILFTDGPDLPIIVGSDPEEITDEMIGHSLGLAVTNSCGSLNSLMIFYTSVSDRQTRELHYATYILDAFSKVVHQTDLQIAGGGLLTGFNFEDSWAIGDDKVYKHYAFAIIFPDHIRISLTILKACQPIGPIMTITEIEGSKLISIDDKSALDVICQLIGRKPNSRGNILNLNLCLGLVKYKEGNEIKSENQKNRVIVSENILDRSVRLLEPDFRVGDHVQLMLRDNDYMMSNASLRENSHSIFSLYIDCAGRASVLSGSLEEEGIVALSSIPCNVPAVGVYSGVEIASIDGSLVALDLTGVMISLVRS